MSIRTDKVASLLQKELSAIFEKELPRSGPLLTVVEVKVTADLGIARVYVSLIGSEKERQELMTNLQGETKYIRKLLSSRIRHQFRRIPEIEFHEDEQYEKARRIDQLLRQALDGSKGESGTEQ
ncbi:30S ribosome-binding factor RbfA [Prosthecochloris sp. N3]|uniref:Ribosome-binding factor A n=1 Tax=Prosthecochloris ethylica TaxID=2743976 RepID=A0ABR9XS83_9CHLB|nr:MULTISPECIES: 30S ribosome-binding factor RbfA [Prosthecochloris]MEC9487164.1 30S ribosome-binding factor RbfA [Prosthecochloris sp.]MBF0586858.1 30S ribosome-binding factor RbfA [Prosthecochloris ethylica]MBF0636794.1 30S ribosome-binding factor RbfA [Prosthecochloris ethylica]NUK48010.1 30S ribosome-binding factor RbfA [Prosthecochloris ethylica]RNA64302.1 30S ribosome-binding factor RbfA [Prosthecochloris sp. ZM_2]